MIKVLETLRIKGTCLKITKAIYSKPRANVHLNTGKLKAFHWKSGTRCSCPLFLFLFNIILDILARVIRKHEQGSTSGKGISQSIFIFSFIWEHKNPRTAKTLLNNKITDRHITISYVIVLIKIAWYCYKQTLWAMELSWRQRHKSTCPQTPVVSLCVCVCVLFFVLFCFVLF